MTVFNVLFVCTGNTCRSPMAEALLRSKLDRVGASGKVGVGSAGISAWEGQPASPEAIGVMNRRDIFSIGSHRARQVRAEQIAGADLVLSMTASHKERLQKCFPGSADRIFLLSEYAGGMDDVADPVGGPMIEYEMCADELDQLTETALGKILAAAGIQRADSEK